MTQYMHLNLFTENPELKSLYAAAVIQHNEKVCSTTHPDAGFDLYMPANVSVPSGAISFKLPLGVKCSAYIGEIPSSFTTVPRSSMGSKTSLRLSNSIGIIDSGYRGELMAFVDNIGSEAQTLTTETRLFQIVAPTLMPIFVEVVEGVEDLGTTIRGEGGFGSTGGTVLGITRNSRGEHMK